MRILLTHRFYWPDSAPYGVLLRSIAEDLAAAGHEVEVFASMPSYRGHRPAPRHERTAGVTIRRVPVFAERKDRPLQRAANVAIYCTALFFAVLRSRAEVVSAATFPPVFAAWTASLAARLRGAKFVYHMMDIHPELSFHSGGRLGRGLPYRLLRRLDTASLRRAAAVIVLSRDMERTIRARPGGEALPIHVINNFLPEGFDEIADPPPDLLKPEGRRRVIYAGNIGRFQNLPQLTEGVAACLDRHPDLEMLFLGSGEALPELEARWKDHPRIRFGGFLPSAAQAHRLIADADVAVVSLAPGVHKVSYPSKTLTYLGLGTPVLAVVDPDSSLAEDIREGGLGVVPRAPTPQDVAGALEALLEALPPRERVRDWYARHASRRTALTRVRRLMADLAGPEKS